MTKRLVVLTVLLLAPLAQGHASPDPLDNEVHLLADDTDDSYAYYDGFDLQDLYVREAYDRQAGEDGLMFRMIIYGGFGPAKIANNLHLDLSFSAGGSAHDYRISSTDGVDWEGNIKVAESSLMTEPTGTVEGSLQVWVANSELGIGVGDTVSDFVWSSYADEDIRDVAPGGRFIPGTGGAGAIDGASTVVTGDITIALPHGYTRSTVSAAANGTVTVTVENLISVIGQHIILTVPEQTGWVTRLINVEPRAVEPGTNPKFTFHVQEAPKDGDLILELTTDLGGHEAITVPTSKFARQDDGKVNVEADTPEDVPAPGKDSPLGAPVMIAALALALVAAARRRNK